MNRSAWSLSALLILTASLHADATQGSGPPGGPCEPKDDCVGVTYAGAVTEITKTSITIQWIQTPGEKPKTFRLSETLVAGKIPMKTRPNPPTGRASDGRVYDALPWFMYRPADVKVGDLVMIEYAHLGTADICDHISIVKRPGGRVPPLPEEAEKLMNPAEILKATLPPGAKLPPGFADVPYFPYHERQNALWDLLDKGIPYPEKFGNRRRWPVAPPPREVKIGPAIAP